MTSSWNRSRLREFTSERAVFMAAVAVVLIFLAHAVYLNCITEDAFIAFRFAHNLVGGHGIVWNVGETPVEGATSFLWLLITSLALFAGFEVELYSEIAGIVASLLTFFVVYRFSRDLFRFSRVLSLIPCGLLALSGPFAAWATSGMETNLFGLLIVTGIYFVGRWSIEGRTQLLATSFFTLFLATLARPEGAMVFGLVFLFAAARAFGEHRATLLSVAAAGTVYVVPFLIYFIWRYQYFGFLLPNTFYAKTGGGLAQVARGMKYCMLFAFHYLFPLAPILAVWAWEKKSIEHASRRLVTVLCLVIVIPYVIYIGVVGGDYMAMYRFFVPILPLIFLIVAASAAALMEKTTLYRRALVASLLVAGVALGAIQSTAMESRLFYKPQYMHGTYRGVLHERWHVNRNRLIGSFFRNNQRGSEDSIGLWAVGVIGYYSRDMKVQSIAGIVDPVIAHEPPGRFGSGMAGHEKNDLYRVLATAPRFLFVDSDFHAEPNTPPRFPAMLEGEAARPEVRALLHTNYELKAVWLRDEANGEEGYLQYFERKHPKDPGLWSRR